MIFFTRELFNGYQPGSGWDRRAMNTWRRNGTIYAKYLDVISPLLPRSVTRLCRAGLHDGVVTSIQQKHDELTIVIDLANALTTFGRGVATLTFEKVSKQIASPKLIGRWWLYEEAHLAPQGRFLLNVFLDRDELAIEASKLIIEVKRRSTRDKRRTRR